MPIQLSIRLVPRTSPIKNEDPDKEYPRMKTFFIKALFTLIHIVTLGQLKFSRSTEGNSLTMRLSDKLWWGYKFYGHPVREPEKGKGIREYFHSHPASGFAAGKSEGGEPIAEAVISFAGDILPIPPVKEGANAHLLDDVSDFLFKADFRSANLESPVVKDLPPNCPSTDMTAPPGMNNTARAISLLTRKGSGINIFSTANNHSLDQGTQGLLATLDFLDAEGLHHVGTARDPEERDSFPILEANGIRVAFLSWTFGLNDKSLPEGQEYLANVLRINLPDADLLPIISQVKQARERKADVVVLFLHWGLEYEVFPLAHQIEKAHLLIEGGVDIIAGNHPHSLQPSERYSYSDSSGVKREGLIFYALGDFISPLPETAFSALGTLARVKLVRLQNSKVGISSAEMKPIYFYRYSDTDIRVLDFLRLKQRLEDGDFSGDPVLSNKHIKSIKKLMPVLEDLMPER